MTDIQSSCDSLKAPATKRHRKAYEDFVPLITHYTIPALDTMKVTKLDDHKYHITCNDKEIKFKSGISNLIINDSLPRLERKNLKFYLHIRNENKINEQSKKIELMYMEFIDYNVSSRNYELNLKLPYNARNKLSYYFTVEGWYENLPEISFTVDFKSVLEPILDHRPESPIMACDWCQHSLYRIGRYIYDAQDHLLYEMK